MPTIQVTTDVMRQLGQVFVHLNEQLDHEMTPQMQNYIGQLEGDWQGVSRKRFEAMFEEWRVAVSHLIAEGEQIGRHLQTIAQQFERVDESF